MTIESNSSHPPQTEPKPDYDLQPDDFDGGAGENGLTAEGLAAKQVLSAISSLQSSQNTNALKRATSGFKESSIHKIIVKPRALIFTLLAIALTFIGIAINNSFLGILGTTATLVLSLAMLLPWLQDVIQEWFSPQEKTIFIAFMGLLAGIFGLLRFSGVGDRLLMLGNKINWDIAGTLADWFGALGQILIAIIAVYVAWRQYVISKDLTIQQNLLTAQQNIITQQQTIDSYFQGVSDLVLDEEGLLEDWPQERAIAEGRTAAIFSSVDGSGKAKILRFLSRSKLLTPLKRDRRLGRAILDGIGGYAEDRLEGVRVIDLGVMLAGADLADNDLRWTDLSEANLVRANLSGCDLVKANLSRTILYDANLSNADLNGVRLFYGLLEKASPRSRTHPPEYETGEHTGAVVENADFTDAQRMSESTRHYCCAWCGEKSRETIPGGCEGIPNKLGR
ncbi:pentapeptide repeat-containing protein [Anabaena cylindrica FACHB-243]|uniref:Pentapeptide repeat protein n=1 Tax=Anabaena cylindrica (strain ATCC 27899 / PCC 7122) TaxID=272123 RepID=K9ZCB2_ANACC|nr:MULTISPECIES: pentapeptide repeat-containing protein [Anabaena]AFZ56222.1 pentapeptide repeat protein [Anabaena cylindrica PCC 7122]MBD2417450.1 pentapeptide repeat-containing protein [Anabaena cylindrica FACHB-243]MBY5284414.1 pentapeptide repeat-containing protein [Anabaena sp. CCAP 1446/1C]MBY5310253.1 pentapeptide repeat-containing protein [Anabaena sp. CCAP 1446/1C]MCM2407619.1 pentapeptide repeat-containing protein [Anabaena sp. CCAP 1446/1C]